MSNSKSTLDSMAGGLLDLLITIGWVVMFIFMLSGWYRILHIKDKSRWGDEAYTWAARILVLWFLSFIVGLVTWGLNDHSRVIERWMLQYPTQLVWVVGIAGGPVVMIVAWVVNRVVYKQDDNIHYRTNTFKKARAMDFSLDDVKDVED